MMSALRAPESWAFDVQERDFPGNRSPPRWKFVCRPKKKNLRAWQVARPATTTPLTVSI
jgi:hypothetical protein